MNITELDLYNKAVLCYIDGPFAFFTTCELSKQQSDDWNDVPYECNAERPYEWAEHRGVPKYEIIQIAYESRIYEPPSYDHYNSPWSVDDINEKKVPWLRPIHNYDKKIKYEDIWAGTTANEFIKLIKKSGGDIYIKT